MKEHLDIIDNWTKSNRPDYFARLLPGATNQQLDDFEHRFSIKLPQDFRLLYSWHNGQPNECSDSFFENRMFTPLHDIAETKAMLDEMIGVDFEDPTWWRKGWIPFLSNGGGSHLCLDLEAVDGGQKGQLVAFWNQDEDRPIEFSSVSAWIAAIAKQMKDGTFEVV